MTVQEFKSARESIQSILPNAEFAETFGGFGFVLGVKIQAGRDVARISISEMPENISAVCDALVKKLREISAAKKKNAASDRINDI